tara:strand:+ start:3619 stop:4845 length:1227 start_codon:yes stop_codon:yes gene_type:complete
VRSPSVENTKFIAANELFSKSLDVPASKSRANRMLLLASITPGETVITNIPSSSDVIDMISSLKAIGLKIETPSEGRVIVKNSFPQCEQKSASPVVVECGYGGTTTRFLAALLILGCNTYHLEASGHMRQRPMSEMIKPLSELGAEVKHNVDGVWFFIKGPVTQKKKSIAVDAARSTQFASALAMVMSLWGGEVRPTGMNASEEYFKMTEDAIEQARNGHWSIPLDFSSLSYPLALAATSGEVIINNFERIDGFQPDSIFIQILKEMGASVEISENTLRVNKNELKAWSGDCSGFPDLVPTLAYVCSYASGTSRLDKLDVLKHKESDRLLEITKLLKMNHIEFSVDGDSLSIIGGKRHQDQTLYQAPDDHRMIMVAALFMRINGGGEIENYDHVKKSYPYFFEDLIES